ncbi:MAG TPA: S53 family peptidase [Candidatus Acidoferrales bacterium]|nr:S53 family peptidase [Candidatus Acidoferrales bacterium]
MNKFLAAGVSSAMLAACAQGSAGGVLPASSAGTYALSATHGRSVVADAATLAAGDRDLGTAPPGRRLDIAVVLRYRNEVALDRLVGTAARGSHWLSDARFDQRFAPAAADYQRLAGSLRKAGFRVTQTYRNRTVVDANGTVEQMERYFGTHLDSVSQPDQTVATINVRPAYAPSGLGTTMLAVEGLDSRVLVQPLYVRVAPRSASAGGVAGKARSKLYGPVSSATGYFGYGPLAFSTAYDLPVVHAGSGGTRYDGTGRTAGIVIDADFLDSDVASFLKYFGIAQTGPAIARVRINGGPAQPAPTSPDSVEATLDVQTILGNAPGVALTVYEIPKLTSSDITDAYNKAVSDDVVDALDSSFGGCEANFPSTARAWSELAKQGVAKGMMLSASSGDGGGGLCVNAPASSPYFVATGGTSLQVGKGGSWSSETGWAGSGGGVSIVFGQPAWQSGIVSDSRGRNVPDIALDANPYTGAAFYFAGSWNTGDNPLGGTSLASPLFVAAVTELDQVHGQRIGGSAQALFHAFQSHGTGPASAPYFHDIVQGTNGPYWAGPGYDLVSGIGSIDAWNLSGSL